MCVQHVLLCVYLCACVHVACREEVPYTHRKHAIMMVTHNMELAIGQQTFQQVRRVQCCRPVSANFR